MALLYVIKSEQVISEHTQQYWVLSIGKVCSSIDHGVNIIFDIPAELCNVLYDHKGEWWAHRLSYSEEFH